MSEKKGNVPQKDVAEIMNTINEALEKLGYEATGYDNTGVFLLVMIDKQ